MDKTADHLVEYTSKFGDEPLPAVTLWQVKCRLIDSIGCALAAYHAPPVEIARRMALPLASGARGARVFGSLVRTAPDLAAFANAMMVRYLDFNDAYRVVDGCHPSDNIPGLLAVAELTGSSGHELLSAIALSYEIQCCYADSIPFDRLGWDQTVPGIMACALACGRLLRLNRSQLLHALSLAITPNLATHQRHVGELSMWKGGYAAMGARQGVFAALLALEGMTGPSDPIEGEHGLLAQTRTRDYALRPLGADRSSLRVARTTIKRWPVRDSCQLPIDAALDLRTKIDCGSIREIKIETYQYAYRGRELEPELWAPRTRETADHSMPFLVAAALIDGDVSRETFERERFLDADVLALMQRMSVVVEPAFTNAVPERRNCRLTALLNDGLSAVSHLSRSGNPELVAGEGDAFVDAKFRRLTEVVLLPPDAARLLAMLWDMERLPEAAAMMDLTRIRQSSQGSCGGRMSGSGS